MLNEIIKLSEPINILDLGSVYIESENINYHKLLEAAPCHIIGFDVNEKEHKVSCSMIGKHSHTIETYPIAVGDGNVHEFKLCSLPTCSSLYEPNIELCKKFQAFDEYLHVTQRFSINTYKLDSLLKQRDIDFIKLDIQGAELLALNHSKNILSQAIIIESEVEFVPQYLNQPLFSEIELFLREQGFMFHTFTGYATRCLKPLQKQHRFAGIKQWLWSDAVFLKNILNDVSRIGTNKLLKMALILDVVYQSYDFSYYCLQEADKQLDTNYCKLYKKILSKHFIFDDDYEKASN